MKRAEEDWLIFLKNRGIEMKSGGRMVFVNLGLKRDNGITSGIHVEIVHALNKACQQLVKEDILHQEEYERFTIPQHPRTKSEFMKPFEMNQEIKDTFNLEHFEEISISNTYCLQYESSKDLNEFSTNYSKWIRTWTEFQFKNCLKGDRLHLSQEIADKCYELVKNFIFSNPDTFLNDHLTYYFIVIEKK